MKVQGLGLRDDDLGVRNWVVHGSGMGFRVTAGCVDEYLTTTTSLEVSAEICVGGGGEGRCQANMAQIRHPGQHVTTGSRKASGQEILKGFSLAYARISTTVVDHDHVLRGVSCNLHEGGKCSNIRG